MLDGTYADIGPRCQGYLRKPCAQPMSPQQIAKQLGTI
jgi:hypothetical protein